MIVNTIDNSVTAEDYQLGLHTAAQNCFAVFRGETELICPAVGSGERDPDATVLLCDCGAYAMAGGGENIFVFRRARNIRQRDTRRFAHLRSDTAACGLAGVLPPNRDEKRLLRRVDEQRLSVRRQRQSSVRQFSLIHRATCLPLLFCMGNAPILSCPLGQVN